MKELHGPAATTQTAGSLLLSMLSLLLAVLLGFLGTFSWPFQGDDYPLLRRVDSYRSQPWGILHTFASTHRGYLENQYGWDRFAERTDHYRPVVEVSFAYDRLLFGNWAPGFRFTNALIHSMTVVMVFLAALFCFQSRMAAWTASVLFLFGHFSATAVFGMLANRTDTLSGMFAILAFFFFLRFRQTDRALFLSISYAATAFALFTKETAVALPVAILVFDFIYQRSWKNWRALIVHLPSFAMLAAYFAVRILLLGEVGAANGESTTVPLHTAIVSTRWLFVVPFVPPAWVRADWLWLCPILFLGGLIGWLCYRDPWQRRTSIAFLAAYGAAVFPMILVMGGIGGRFLYTGATFFFVWLGGVVAGIWQMLRQKPGWPNRLFAAVIAALCLAHATWGAASLYTQYQINGLAARMAKNTLDSLHREVPDATPDDKMFLIAVPAGIGGASVFYNGMCDAVAITFQQPPRCFVLAGIALRGQEPPDLQISIPAPNLVEIQIKERTEARLVLPQTNVQGLKHGERLRNRYSQVEVLRSDNRTSMPGVRALRIEVNPDLVDGPGRNLFFCFDGASLKRVVDSRKDSPR